MISMSPKPYRFLSVLALLVLNPALAQQGVPDLAGCAQITDAAQRLACYDRLAGVSPAPAQAAATVSSPSAAQSEREAQSALDLSPEKTRGFSLADHWELDQEHKRGVFNFRPHYANYLMITRTVHPNDAPYRPFRNLADFNTDLAHNELVYQLSFKTKVLQDIGNKPVDLWFGYTQNSFWQAGNRQASSPFRETNYQPELMAVMPLNFDVLGMHASYLNLGVVHQSNGQISTLSRSWNRVYAQVGLERAGFTVLGRVWKRINEPANDDDNPNIVDYMGRGDLAITYRNNGHDYSALLRRNFSTNRGAVQLSWAFPLAGHFKGYVQYFSGYGQSLIDYDYYQNVVGVGLLGTF